MKHYFQSEYASRVRMVEETPDRIVFVGHYMWGDNPSFSVPLVAIVMGGVLVLSRVLVFSGDSSQVASRVVLAAGVALICCGIWFMAYRKKIVFDLRTRSVEVTTRLLFRTYTEQYTFNEVRIHAEEIHIRLAEGCGAVDLILPGYKIRLSVFGLYRGGQQLADWLRERVGTVENLKKR